MARIVRIIVCWIMPKVQIFSFSSLSHLVLLASLLERYHHYPCFKGEENEILGLSLSWICVKQTWHQRILLFGILLFRWHWKALWTLDYEIRMNHSRKDKRIESERFCPIYSPYPQGFLAIHFNVLTYFIKNFAFLVSIKTLEFLVVNSG